MPRTKRPRITSKSKISTSSRASSQQSLEGLAQSDIEAHFEEEFARKLKNFDELLELKLFSLNQRKEWLKLKCLSEENVPLVKPMSDQADGKKISESEPCKRLLHTQTESPASSSQDSLSCPPASSSEIRKQKAPSSTNNILQTPVGLSFNPSLPPITPKIALGTPVSVMRLPHRGEVTVSMTGSPLLATAAAEEKRAKLNVPLGGGRIISIVGEGTLNPYDIPALDENTKKQLQALHDNLQALVNMRVNSKNGT